MPLKIIKQIKNEQSNAGSEKWTYRSSGNVLELLVLPQFIHNKKAFRCSVISAGQALAALKTQYNKLEDDLFIQTFPNIENPRVICSIRIDDSGYSGADTAPEPVIHENISSSINGYLSKTAENFQLSIRRAYPPKDILEPMGEHARNHNHAYLLVSKLDNPFTWLNVGYWKEAVIRNMKLHKSDRNYFMCHFSSQKDEFKKHTDLPSDLHLQGFFSY